MLTFVHIANFATLQPWLHVGSFTCRKVWVMVYVGGGGGRGALLQFLEFFLTTDLITEFRLDIHTV